MVLLVTVTSSEKLKCVLPKHTLESGYHTCRGMIGTSTADAYNQPAMPDPVYVVLLCYRLPVLPPCTAAASCLRPCTSMEVQGTPDTRIWQGQYWVSASPSCEAGLGSP